MIFNGLLFLLNCSFFSWSEIKTYARVVLNRSYTQNFVDVGFVWGNPNEESVYASIQLLCSFHSSFNRVAVVFVANITVEKLTIGNEKNTIGTENFGDVCIKGSAQVPVGYMKPSDTLDVRATVSIDIGIIKREFPCMLLRALLREQVMEADVENGGDYSYDYEDDTLELVKEIFDHFDNTW